jgi:hypothetical protein
MNRNVLKYLLMLVVVFLGTTACSDDDATGTSPGEDVGVEVTSSEVYRPMELTQALSQSDYLEDNGISEAWMKQLVNGAFDVLMTKRINNLDSYFHQEHQESGFLSFRQWQVESYCFKYRTLSAAGEPITLSGRVTLPNMKDESGHEVSSLSIYVHHYFWHWYEAPSKNLSPAVLRAFFNSAVIEPDLEGYGVTADCIPCGISYIEQARQVIDCVWAALKVMQDHGVKFSPGGHSTLWGLSLGSPVAIATARYCEEMLSQQQQDAINLSSVFCDSGPYLLGDILDYWDANPKVNASLICRLLMFIHAFSKENLEGYEPRDFAAEWMQSYQVTYKGENVSLYDAIKDCGGDETVFDLWPETIPKTKVSNCLATEMMQPDGMLNRENPKAQAFIRILKKCSDVGTWLPKASVYMTHSSNDTYIPFVQAEAFYNQIKGGNNVNFKDVTGGITGSITDVHEACTINGLIGMALYEEPADAFEFLQ